MKDWIGIVNGDNQSIRILRSSFFLRRRKKKYRRALQLEIFTQQNEAFV